MTGSRDWFFHENYSGTPTTIWPKLHRHRKNSEEVASRILLMPRRQSTSAEDRLSRSSILCTIVIARGTSRRLRIRHQRRRAVPRDCRCCLADHHARKCDMMALRRRGPGRPVCANRRGTWRSRNAGHKAERAQKISERRREPQVSTLGRSLDPGLGRGGAFDCEVRCKADDLSARRPRRPSRTWR